MCEGIRVIGLYFAHSNSFEIGLVEYTVLTLQSTLVQCSLQKDQLIEVSYNFPVLLGIFFALADR